MKELTIVQKRWLECKFYFMCVKIYNLNNDMHDIMNFLELLGTFYNYKIEMSKYIAHNIITNMRYKPRKRETVLLGKKLDVPIKKILEITGYSERQMYRIIKEDIYEHLRFAPAFEEEHYLLMNEIFTAVDKFKELLI